MKKTSIILLFVLLVFTGCKRDIFTPYGEWETVTTEGYEWEYNIQKDGQFCRLLPEYFPGTSFCFDYSISPNKLQISISNEDAEVWEIDPVCEDAADVTVTKKDGSVTRFIIKRKND